MIRIDALYLSQAVQLVSIILNDRSKPKPGLLVLRFVLYSPRQKGASLFSLSSPSGRNALLQQ